MSLFNKQIEQNLSINFKKGEKGFQAHIIFDHDFIGFRGHFPDNPILPGIVMIKILIMISEKLTNTKYDLINIKNAKFIDQVVPKQPLLITVQLPETIINKTPILIKGLFYQKENLAATISLLLKTKKKISC